MLRGTWWRAAFAGVMTIAGLVGSATPLSAGPCYVITIYDGSGNPKQVEVCPYD